jgi:hypothetical protein
VACAVPTSVASQLAREPVLCDAFVPDYRCGAVPDFNRVPSCDACYRRTDAVLSTVRAHPLGCQGFDCSEMHGLIRARLTC